MMPEWRSINVPETGHPDPTHGMIAVTWQDLTVRLTAVCAYAAMTRVGVHRRRVAVTPRTLPP
jgi:hypothetical protein